jgi:hypothetical protein
MIGRRSRIHIRIKFQEIYRGVYCREYTPLLAHRQYSDDSLIGMENPIKDHDDLQSCESTGYHRCTGYFFDYESWFIYQLGLRSTSANKFVFLGFYGAI